MDLRKVDNYLHKWEEIVSQHSAYSHLQQQALIRDIHSSFDVAEILYFLTLVPHYLEQHNYSHLIAPYQRFTIELISSFPSGEMEKYQKLIKKCNSHLLAEGSISPGVYEQKLKEVENSRKNPFTNLLKSLRKKLKK